MALHFRLFFFKKKSLIYHTLWLCGSVARDKANDKAVATKKNFGGRTLCRARGDCHGMMSQSRVGVSRHVFSEHAFGGYGTY